MRVLLAGAGGALGTSVGSALRAAGVVVVPSPRWTLAELETGPPAALAERLPPEVDSVVNAAGLAAPAAGPGRELSALNVALPLVLATHARRRDVPFTQVSSLSVLGAHDRRDAAPGTLAEPATPYGASKLAAELALVDLFDDCPEQLRLIRFGAWLGDRRLPALPALPVSRAALDRRPFMDRAGLVTCVLACAGAAGARPSGVVVLPPPLPSDVRTVLQAAGIRPLPLPAVPFTAVLAGLERVCARSPRWTARLRRYEVLALAR